MGSLSLLPNELIAHLLTYCAFYDVIACQCTCRFLHQLITTCSSIQYRVALEISGLEDNPQCKLTILDRLNCLRHREAAWSFFQPNFTEEIPVNHPSVVVYELSGGTYLLSDIARKSVNRLQLPSTPSESVPTWSHIPVTEDLLDFGLSVTEHDLIGVLTTTSDDVGTTLQIQFLQLSTGLPHPLSSGSPMQFKQLTLVDNVGVGIEIVGDLAALVVRDLSFGHHIRDKVLILDWKRGIVRAELYTNSRRYQSAIFLTPDIVLVTNAHERCLEIWRIPAINETATMPFICGTPELSLAMPAIHPGFVVSEFACRGAPNPALTIPNTSRPFHSSATTAILVFHLTISPIDPRVPIPFIFFAHRKTFLDLLATAAAGKELSNSNESLNPLSPTSNTIPVLAPPIPWSAWGRPVTRWLHARNIPTEWITSTSGQRFAFVSTHAPALPQPIVVLDFNEHHVKKVTADQKNDLPPYHGAFTPSKVLRESQTQTGHTGNVTNTTNTTASIAIESIDDSQRKLWRRVWLETVPDAYAKMAVFREEVGGHLPYVAVKSEKLYDFHGVLMDDERIIGIKRNRVLSGVESIEVIHMG